MIGNGSVTVWIADAKAGCSEAASRLWRRYAPPLISIARRKLATTSRRTADEEDLVSSTFASFLIRVREGRYPDLRRRNELWALLHTIASRKVINFRVTQYRRAPLQRLAPSQTAAQLEQLADDSVGAEALVEYQDLYESLLGRLSNPVLRRIAELRCDGFSTMEIGRLLGLSRPTVVRKLALIRQVWSGESIGE